MKDTYEDDKGQEDVINLFTNPPFEKNRHKILLLAYPGAGKTTTIARSIEELVMIKNVAPEELLVLTFTNRTRRDLVEKIQGLALLKPQEKQKIFNRIKTFHSLARSITKANKIITESEERKIIQVHIDSVRSRVGNLNEGQIMMKVLKEIKIMATKNLQLKDHTEAILSDKNTKEQQKVQVMEVLDKYFQEMDERYLNHETTFESSLVRAVECMNDPEYESDYLKIKYLIVDQFQDSNPTQLNLISSILDRKNMNVNLLMVGDPDQNIYTWRGAYISKIRDFVNENDFTRLSLNHTYRLNNNMKDISQKLIQSHQKYNELRRDFYFNQKELISKNQKNNILPVVEIYDSEFSQVKRIVDRIVDHHQKQNIPFGSMTVILRSLKGHFVKKLTHQIKRRQKILGIPIPYDIQYQRSTFKSKAVKYLINYLLYFYYEWQEKQGIPKDKNDFIKKIITQIDKIGKSDKTLEKMLDDDEIHIKHVYSTSKSRAKIQKYQAFFRSFDEIRSLMADESKSASEICEQICENIFIQGQEVTQEWSTIQKDRYIQQFIDFSQSIKDHQIPNESWPPIMKLAYFIEENILNEKIKVLSSQEENIVTKSDRLQIQTMHNVKGLQFEVVFIPKMNYGVYQHDFQKENQDLVLRNGALASEAQYEQNRQYSIQLEIEWEKQSEELRLFYTAITRSSKYNYISKSKKDNDQGFYRFFGTEPIENPQFDTICGIIREYDIIIPEISFQEEDRQCKEAFQLTLTEQFREKQEKAMKRQSKRNRINRLPENSYTIEQMMHFDQNDEIKQQGDIELFPIKRENPQSLKRQEEISNEFLKTEKFNQTKQKSNKKFNQTKSKSKEKFNQTKESSTEKQRECIYNFLGWKTKTIDKLKINGEDSQNNSRKMNEKIECEQKLLVLKESEEKSALKESEEMKKMDDNKMEENSEDKLEKNNEDDKLEEDIEERDE